MAAVDVQTRAHRRFEIDGLFVAKRLLGQSHQFEVDGRSIVVTLPIQTLEDIPGAQGRTVKSSWYQNDPDNPDTTFYQVRDVDVFVDIPNTVSVDSRALSGPWRDTDFSAEQRTGLEQISEEYSRRIRESWEHWRAVVRWVAGPNSIEHPSWHGFDRHGGETDIILRNNHRRVWTGAGMISVYHLDQFDAVKWQFLQEALASGLSAPVWFQYLNDAHTRLNSFEYREAILSAAVACETIIRSIFWLSVSSASKAASDLIDRTSVQAILDHWSEFAGYPPNDSWSLKEVRDLFRNRNRIMHSGKFALEESSVSALVRSASKFVESGDVAFCTRNSTRCWRRDFLALAGKG